MRSVSSADAYRFVAAIRQQIEKLGYSEVARRTGLRDDFIRQAFRDGSESCPNLVTVVTVAEAIGLRLIVRRR